MTPTQIGLLVLGGLAVFIVAAMVMQGIENQRRQKRLRVLALKDQIRRADHLFHALPAELRSANMDKLLLNYLMQHWREIGTLDRAAGASAQVEMLSERAKQLSEGRQRLLGLPSSLIETRRAARAPSCASLLSF